MAAIGKRWKGLLFRRNDGKIAWETRNNHLAAASPPHPTGGRIYMLASWEGIACTNAQLGGERRRYSERQCAGRVERGKKKWRWGGYAPWLHTQVHGEGGLFLTLIHAFKSFSRGGAYSRQAGWLRLPPRWEFSVSVSICTTHRF